MRSRSKAYSERSQKHWLKQRELENQVTNLKLSISLCERRIAKAEEITASVIGGKAQGRQYHPVNLGEELGHVEDEKREVAAYKERITSLEAEIKALRCPTPPQRAQRRKHQEHLAKLASERLAVDHRAQAAVQTLRELLEHRLELTEDMRKSAVAIDFTLSADHFDEIRFDQLLGALPADLVTASEGWVAQFIGKAKMKTEVYTVAREGFTRPETLAHCGLYEPDETIRLTKEQADALVSAAPWDDPPILNEEIMAKIASEREKRMNHSAGPPHGQQGHKPLGYFRPIPATDGIVA